MKNEEIRTIISLKNRRKRPFLLRWNITRLCNYDCAFCIQGDRQAHLAAARGESKELRRETAAGIVRFIEKELRGKYHRIHFELIGGEALILPDFPELLAGLVNCRFPGEIRFQITTNLSADKEYLDRLLEPFRRYKGAGRRSLAIAASFYKGYTDLETIREKLRFLLENGRRKALPASREELRQWLRSRGKIPFCTVRCGMPIASDKDYQEYLQLGQELPGLRVYPIILRDYPVTYSDETRTALQGREQQGNLFIEKSDGQQLRCPSMQALVLAIEGQECFDPCGCFCDAGWNSLSVTNLGMAVRCPNTEEAPLGRITEEDCPRCQEMQPCPSHRCACSNFSLITRDPSARGIDTQRGLDSWIREHLPREAR